MSLVIKTSRRELIADFPLSSGRFSWVRGPPTCEYRVRRGRWRGRDPARWL